MLGAIAGDIIGKPYEFHNIKTTDFPLFSEKSRFSDDTVMTIAVAQGLRQGLGDPEASRVAVIDALHAYGAWYPRAGYGGRFGQWLEENEREPYNSWGNGSAMRVSAAAWLYDDLTTVEQYAEISAAVTHNHPEGIKGAQAVAAAIFLARTGADKAQIQTYITSRYGYDLDFTLDTIRPTYTFDVSCQGSVPQAIRAFLEGTGFENAVRLAVSIGGDSDTIAAITGSIAEAYHGDVPPDIAEETLQRLNRRLREQVLEFRALFAHKRRICHNGV